MTITIGTGGRDTTAVAMDIVMIPTTGGIAADMIVMIIGGMAGGMIMTTLGMTAIALTIVIANTTMINFALMLQFLENARSRIILGDAKVIAANDAKLREQASRPPRLL
jgi:hypothetical protein